MKSAASHVDGIPSPLDGDDDDVAWALQTAAVEWRRAAYDDALNWLRRAASAAEEAGHGPRAAQLEGAAAWIASELADGTLGTARGDESIEEIEELDAIEEPVVAAPAGGRLASARSERPGSRAPLVDDDDGLEMIEGIEVSLSSLPPAPSALPARSRSVPPSSRSSGPSGPPAALGALPPLPPPPVAPNRSGPPAALPPPPRPPPAPAARGSASAPSRGSGSTAPGSSRAPLAGRRSGSNSLGAGRSERRSPPSSMPPPRSLEPRPDVASRRSAPAALEGDGGRRRGSSFPPASSGGDTETADGGRRPPIQRAERSVGGGAARGAPVTAPPVVSSPLPPGRSVRGRRRAEPTASLPPGSEPLPELAAEHPESTSGRARSARTEVELPLVHEPSPGDVPEVAATSREEEPAPLATEPEPAGPESADSPAAPEPDPADSVEGRRSGGSEPELPDLEGLELEGVRDSLIPTAPGLERAIDEEDAPAGEGGGAAMQIGSALTDAGDEPSADPAVLGVRLSTVRGLQDLPVESQAVLARRAKLEVLQPEEEISFFAVALVVKGDVSIVPAVSDIPCGYAQKGEVVFTRGSLDDGVALSVVAGPDGAAVAAWDQATLDLALSGSPWVGDDLAEVADRYQAMAGATMGPLGARLDESLMAGIFAQAAVRLLLEGDVLLEMGRPVQGLFVVGAGRVELVAADGTLTELGPGDLVFPTETLSSAPAPALARARFGGALVLQVGRHETHELLVSVPPLLEVLATG